MKIDMKVDVKVPKVPNFLLAEGTERTFDIADFQDSELREIGKEWVEELVAHAARRRLNRGVMPCADS